MTASKHAAKAGRPESALTEASDQCRFQARAIQETVVAGVLATCIVGSDRRKLGSCAFKVYHDNVLEAAGQPKDPIEIMLVEQLLMAHHRIGSLHAQAACASTTEEAKACNAAAARLLAEFRKSSLVLREFRTPIAPKHLTVVNQQNVASGNQQIAYLNEEAAQPSGPETGRDSELGAKSPEAITYEPPVEFCPRFQTERSPAAELVPAWPSDARGPRAIAAIGPYEPSMDGIDGAENGVW